MKRTLAALLVVVAFGAHAGTSTWNGTTGDWSDGGKWNNGVPGNGDSAIIGAGTVWLTASSAALADLTMSGGTLVFTNWDTKLTAQAVSISGGSVTHADNYDTNAIDGWDLVARVWIACSNLTVTAAGKIDVVGKGYPGGTNQNTTGYGPGGGTVPVGGGSYAGYGGNSTSLLYGSATAPTNPGSGGCGAHSGGVGADGGGVVKIDADGTVTVNGTITADGDKGNSWHGPGGSGGSIWITCRTLVGSGVIRAAGGNGSNNGAGGSGGRVAIEYDEAAQLAAGVPGLTVSAAGGKRNTELLTWGWQVGDLGTLYFKDNQFLQGVVRHSGKWISPAASGDWALDSLTLSNGWLRFPTSGGMLTVTNSVLLTGGATLELGGNAYWTAPVIWAIPYPPANFLYSAPSSHSMRVGGDLTLTNAGNLRLYSAATNESASHGVLVSLTGTMTIALGCTNWVVSHWTNGGSARFEMNNFMLASGGVVNANQGGFGGGLKGENAGYGPGSANRTNIDDVTGAGAGYGGRGGASQQNAGGPACGSSNAPSIPGSGGDPGGTLNVCGHGGAGGGLVRLIARGQATVNGTITANGQNGYAWHGGGGSGGGVWIACKGFSGSGLMRANGGDKNGNGGSGGGGRIAVWYDVPQSRWSEIEQGAMTKVVVATNMASFAGSTEVKPGIDGSYAPQPAAGTVVFLTVLPSAGTVIMVR